MSGIRVFTASEISAWKSCPKKWWFRYHEKLVPLMPQKPLSYGSLVHYLLEAHYSGTSFNLDDVPLDAYALAEAKALVEGYKVHDPVVRMDHKVKAIEESFRVPLRSPSGRHYSHLIFAGKKDLRTADRFGNLWLWDHKTSSSALNRDWLGINDQMAYYLWSDWELGHNPIGIIYNLIRKPIRKPHAGESPREWGERIEKDIKARPEFYFQREAIIKRPEELRAIERELWKIVHLIGKGIIYRNPRSCQIMGCAYRELCVNDSKMARATRYKYEEIHIELGGENGNNSANRET